jgi:NADPH2:quinone reductase
VSQGTRVVGLVEAGGLGAARSDSDQSAGNDPRRGDLGLAIEHIAPRGIVVNIATQSDDETVTIHATCFDRANGASIYTLNLPDELVSHASGARDLTRLCTLMADGRLDGQIELEASWRDPARALDALLKRHIGGKALLHVD